MSGPALTLHPTITALVDTAVRLYEVQLWRHHEQRLDKLRVAAAPLLASVPGPVLLVDEHGWVAHTSGVAARSRIAAPRGEQALTVPGLGLCLPERIGDGWLVRPAGADTTMTLVLDLSGAPTVQVTGSGAEWRSALTAKHAEILLLLHTAGPAGLTAAALSEALYGDTEHIVTVRAEVSRLRRAVGSVVESQPYRIVDTVRLTVTAGADSVLDSHFVRNTASSTVRAHLARH